MDCFVVHDVGKAINRGGVLGQFYGGVAMGLGYGLLEEFDFEDGVPKQLNFDEYLIPTSMDVPRDQGHHRGECGRRRAVRGEVHRRAGQ